MTHTFTLAFNLPSEIEIITKLLYEQNGNADFKHLIVDIGFPLEYGSDIPDDIEFAKEFNSILLKDIARRYECDYIKMENVGVSQNWSAVFKYLGVTDKDVLIGVEPDEKPVEAGYIKAMADVLMSGEIALASLLMRGQEKWLAENPYAYNRKIISGNKCCIVNGINAMAMIGYSGKFLNEIGGIPVPENSHIYGYIESASYNQVKEKGYEWCYLEDYTVEHQENVPLLRQWKTDITSGEYQGKKQIQFSEWLNIKK